MDLLAVSCGGNQRLRFGQNQLEILVLFLKLTDNSSAFPNSCTVSPSRWGARNGTCPLPIRVVQCSGGSEQLWTSANLTASAAGDLQLAIRYGYVRTTVQDNCSWEATPTIHRVPRLPLRHCSSRIPRPRQFCIDFPPSLCVLKVMPCHHLN